ncbi:MAG: hypothetical protein EPO08_21415 [Rhodospirillaceae bacterium]|nr:MAG: hypothetical protein EPO08_21415 [Rhodospirillaceae bacterium]
MTKYTKVVTLPVVRVERFDISGLTIAEAANNMRGRANQMVSERTIDSQAIAFEMRQTAMLLDELSERFSHGEQGDSK